MLAKLHAARAGPKQGVPRGVEPARNIAALGLRAMDSMFEGYTGSPGSAYDEMFDDEDELRAPYEPAARPRSTR